MGAPRPRLRRSGRLFLGPLDNSVRETETDGSVRPTAASIAVVTAAAKRFADNIAAIASGGYWGVWSRRNASVQPVVGGVVPNSFAVQRKRREATTIRTLWVP